MAEDFNYDVFLSHSSKDKDIVRDVAERLRADGLRVWFDEWILKPGDSIPSNVDKGLEQSRILVLCMSAQAFGSDWAQLESYTFRFRDPLNKERRFIPLRLDEAPIKGSLAQFLYINWLPEAREQEYAMLLEACRLPVAPTMAEAEAADEGFVKLNYLYKATPFIGRPIFLTYAFSQDGKRVLSGDTYNTVRLWDVKTGHCLRIYEGHSKQVNRVLWSTDERYVFSCSHDNTVRLWNASTRDCLHVVKGGTNGIRGMAFSSDQRRVLMSGHDKSVRLMEVKTDKCLRELKGHKGEIWSVAWSADESRALSGSSDGTVRLWDVDEEKCLRILKGHKAFVWSVAWSADKSRALSGSSDGTVRLWDVDEEKCLRILKGHTANVLSVAWSADESRALSGSSDGTVRLWDVDKEECLRVLEGHTGRVQGVAWSADHLRAFSGDENGVIRVWNLSEIASDLIQYTNAKVLLVGDTGVGKTGLSNYLTLGIKDEERNTSTDGAWATQWKLPHTANTDGVEREIWLWDFAGQVDYRLVHQLYMDETAAAVLVFNPQQENPFEGLGQWDRDLQKAARKPFAKLLAAGRTDRGGLIVSDASMEKFMRERSFVSPLQLTSAKTGEGCDALRDAIIAAIDWQNIPETTSPVLYHRLKQEILNLRDSGFVLIRLAELKQRMEVALAGERFELAELQTVVGLLAGPGMIQRVDFGGFILLKPEVLSRYAAAVVRRVRKHPQELGCIREDELLAGKLDYQDFERLPIEDESVVLRTLHETFISRAWCLRQPCDGSALLTFPSYFRRERKEQPGHPNVLVTYRFSGPIDEVYATLVVRLHHTEAFDADELWKDAADFQTQTDQKLGLKLIRENEGTARLEVYFNPDVDENSRLIFLRYVHNHLNEHAQDVVRLRHYCCSNKKCDAHNQPFTDQPKIDKALANGKDKIFCSDCGKPILLRDVMEQKFESPAVKEQVRKEEEISKLVIDNESRELILVGHAYSISAEAGQIYRGFTNSDHGIDGEIEFKDDALQASGKRLYMQLKSGDSYLTTRKRDGAEIFQIKNERWVKYWQQQAYPVMLVIRNSDGEIRWMDVTEYLRRESNNGKKPVRQIVFQGERFDVMSVRRWRDRVLKQGLT